MNRVLIWLFSFITGVGICLSASYGNDPRSDHHEAPLNDKTNFLLIIADDLGVDCVEAYGEHPEPGHTPVIDSLAAKGLLFRNAWSYPMCSPARACLLTGRHAYRTGIGHHIDYENSTLELSVNEVTIPKILGPEYRTAVVGKWHLSVESGSALMHPMLLGFDHHWGSMDNLDDTAGELAYYQYEKNVDGVLKPSNIYATTDTVNDALELIDSFGQQPWFVLLAFNAPHGPFHKPPEALHTYELPQYVMDDLPMHMRAMAEAMDTEIGRLLSSINPVVLSNTVIIFIGDNGTDPVATTLPFLKEHAKTTVYEGGVNVPLIITGPGIVHGAECGALVSVSDIMATVAEIAGVECPAAEDSISMAPYFADPGMPCLRPWEFSEKFKPNGFHHSYYNLEKVVRDDRYKLMHVYETYSPTIKEILFFNLHTDPFELINLLEGTLTPEELFAYNQLTQVMRENARSMH